MLPCAELMPSVDEAVPLLPWDAVAFGFAIYNSAAEEAFLKEAARTWLPMARGADVLLTTDLDDPRQDERLSGLVAVEGVRTHVHRCAICCSGGHVPPGRSTTPAINQTAAEELPCTGVHEAWAARTKVLHMLAEAARRFSQSPRKLYLMKLDADTLVHPPNLRALLSDLASFAAAQPLLLGLAACRSEARTFHGLPPTFHGPAPNFRWPSDDLPRPSTRCRSEALPSLCHAAGGAGYVLSWRALTALVAFVEERYGERWRATLDASTYGGEDVAVALALKETTGAAVLNCGGFHQASTCCFWLLLVAVGCCWLLLVTAGCCWLLLVAAGCCWLLLVAAGCCWLLLVASSDCFWLLC